MMMPGPLTYIGPDAPAALSAYVAERGLTRFDLLADVNTWEALGQQAAARAGRDRGRRAAHHPAGRCDRR